MICAKTLVARRPREEPEMLSCAKINCPLAGMDKRGFILVLKIINEEAGWQASVRFTDVKVNSLNGIRISRNYTQQ
jgi:hypothetical protein